VLPEPAEVGDAVVSEDERQLGVTGADGQRVTAQGRDAAPGMGQHRAAAFGRHGEHGLEALVVEPEALGARVELDAPGAGVQRPLGLGQRIVGRVEPAERHELAARRLRLGDHPVVRRAVPIGLLRREHDGSRARAVEPRDQLLVAAPEPVRIVAPRVRVRIEQLDPGHERGGGVEPGPQDLVGVHEPRNVRGPDREGEEICPRTGSLDSTRRSSTSRATTRTCTSRA
jgi:hypothetical protein